jgi:hypothetical protein
MLLTVDKERMQGLYEAIMKAIDNYKQKCNELPTTEVVLALVQCLTDIKIQGMIVSQKQKTAG